MAVEQFANEAETTLSAAIETTDGTSISVTSASGFPDSAQYRIRIDDEIMLVTGGAGTTTWTVTRGAESTTAATHLNGATVTHVLTAAALEQLKADIEASVWADVQASQLVNEFKGFPSPVGIDIDLDAANQWWDKEGTPTTAVTMVDVAGEAGLTETYEYALKTITDAADEGLSQTWTYADEPRVKSGRELSVMCAIWSVGGLGVSAKLVNSDASETAGDVSASMAAWTIVKIEGHVLAGTSCQIQVTADGAGTFYVVPLGACIGPAAVPLPCRPSRYQNFHASSSLVVNDVDPANTSRVDVDVTSVTSPLAWAAEIWGNCLSSSATEHVVYVWTNGNAEAAHLGIAICSGTSATIKRALSRQIVLDDAQIFEYAASNAEVSRLSIWVIGFWEWA